MSVTAYQLDNAGLLIHAIPIPASADKGYLQVLVVPPEVPTGSVARWTTALSAVADIEYGTDGTGSWEILEDHRKDELWSAYQTPYTIGATLNDQSYDGLGPVPAWLYETEPPIPLATAQANQTAIVSASCSQAIYAGATSSALGSLHTYPTDDKNQANMTASVVASTLPNLPADWTTPFLCADSSDVWAMRPHTAAQIQQAGSDIKSFIVSNIEKNATLAAEIAAAKTVSAIQAIVW